MGKRKYLIWGIFVLLLLSIFIGAQKAQATDSEVVINEVMANAPTPESDLEWIELYNNGANATDLKDWQIDGKIISTTTILIESNDYLILARDSTKFKNYWPSVTVPVIQVSMVLSNSADKITLENADASYIEEFEWTIDAGDSISWERIDSFITADDNWHQSLIAGGTPGEKNSVTGISPPSSPTLVSPTDGQKIAYITKVDCQWQTTEINVTFEIVVDQSASFSDPIIDEPNLFDSHYLVQDLEAGVYFWKVITSNGLYENESAIFSFEILPIVYSDKIIINELYPDPISDASDEWIELFNGSTENVDLKDWLLEDLKGSVHQYKITESLIIPAWGYVLIRRDDSGIVLNNDQDGVRLIRPDGRVLYETPIFIDGDDGWSYARNTVGTWEWTTTITPMAANIIIRPELEDAGGDDEEVDDNIPLNAEPLEIKTGEFRDYENYLVIITGEVIETSGNTFYLDDGSGKAKVYIQESKDIDKPPMHKGDIFQVVGIVNLYRQTWRILPQKQDDIKLIQAAEGTSTGSSVIKKASAKSTSTKSPTTSATARSPTSTKKVASIGDPSIQAEGIKTPWWIQIFKTLTGLAIIILVLIIIKIIKIGKTNKPLGGNFGDET